MSKTLVIMAAGLGSRYKGGIKQITPVGPDKEIIIDYSLHDALKAGFDRIVFVIRKDIEEDFREAIGSRMEEAAALAGATVEYAFQQLEDVPVEVPAGRTKPWGTGQAVLAAKAWLDEPFVVINADDYYGRHAFEKMSKFLEEPGSEQALAGFILGNTLSENGTVTRGIVKMNEDGLVTDVDETKNLRRLGDVAEADGCTYPLDSHVSMNMWGFRPSYVPLLEEGFGRFLHSLKDPLTDEFLLPSFNNLLVHEGKIKVRVLETPDKWFGITYQEDLPGVKAEFEKLYDEGVYARPLYSDLTSD